MKRCPSSDAPPPPSFCAVRGPRPKCSSPHSPQRQHHLCPVCGRAGGGGVQEHWPLAAKPVGERRLKPEHDCVAADGSSIPGPCSRSVNPASSRCGMSTSSTPPPEGRWPRPACRSSHHHIAAGPSQTSPRTLLRRLQAKLGGEVLVCRSHGGQIKALHTAWRRHQSFGLHHLHQGLSVCCSARKGGMHGRGGVGRGQARARLHALRVLAGTVWVPLHATARIPARTRGETGRARRRQLPAASLAHTTTSFHVPQKRNARAWFGPRTTRRPLAPPRPGAHQRTPGLGARGAC